MRRMKLPLAIALSVSVFLSGTVGYTQNADSIALIIGTDDIVTKREWNSAYAQAQAEMRTYPPQARLSGEALKNQVVRNVALNKIMEKISASAGINIPDSAVMNAVNDIARRNGATVQQLQEYLRSQGLSFEGFKENIRKQMMSAELRNEFVRSIKINEDELDIYMRSHEFKELQKELAKQKTPHVKVEHILVRVDNDTTETEARLRINSVRERLLAGEDFKNLARAQSEDPVSAAKGGELGWVSQGQLVPEFEKAMMSLPIGKLSEPVRTPYGFHLIKVLERKTGIVDESQLRDTAKDFYFRKKAAQQFGLWQESLLSDVYIERRI